MKARGSFWNKGLEDRLKRSIDLPASPSAGECIFLDEDRFRWIMDGPERQLDR